VNELLQALSQSRGNPNLQDIRDLPQVPPHALLEALISQGSQVVGLPMDMAYLAQAALDAAGVPNPYPVGRMEDVPLTSDWLAEGAGIDVNSPLYLAMAMMAPGIGGKAKAVGNAPLLGRFATSTVGRIRNKTNELGGYSVNPATGDVPGSGLMVGKYANDSGKNLVLQPGENLSAGNLIPWAGLHRAALSRTENYLGTWRDPSTGITYGDVSRRFEPNETRKATKFGERTGQIAGFDLDKMEEFPIGNWLEFIHSPQFSGRLQEMEKVGHDYLAAHPADEWWDIHNTVFERIYGEDNLAAVAGLIASTAPNTNPTQNLRIMSELMRRHLIGEDVVQPAWRVPEGTQTRTPGVRLSMHEAHPSNIESAAAGNLDALRADKVREEAKALMGDPGAVVLDRWHARIAEDPAIGVFTGAAEGKIPKASAKLDPYAELKAVITKSAEKSGRSPRDYSADVWTGVRETVKRTNELFGQPFKGSAVSGESKSYADLFDDLIESKAKFLGISRKEFERKLSKGDAELLGLVLATPLGAYLYRQHASTGESDAGQTF
jgi:hypothetical protein